MALVRTNTRARKPGLQPATAPPAGYGPADLQSAYNLTADSAADGSGELVAIVDAYNDPDAAADLAVYRAQYGLPPCTAASGCFTQVNQQGATSPLPGANTDWAEEESLDLDMVSAICPNCRIDLVEATANSIADMAAAEDTAVDALHAKFVSNSWGGSGDTDAGYGSSFNHPGVAITAAAGDYGYSYGVIYPAASQFVTSVGGTTLTTASNARGWTETAWGNASGGEGTGAGCTEDGKPSWQSDTGCQNRTDNDVAAVADPSTGVAVYDSQPYGSLPAGWQVLGGTSVATPIIAASYALAGPPAAGTYPAQYPYLHTGDLYDVTSGADGSCTTAYLCTAQVGYDGPTGWGTPDGTGAFALGSIAGNLVTLVNPGPLTSAVGTPLSLQLQATDTGAGQTLTYSATGLPAGLSLNPATGVISGTPSTPGQADVTITATDGTGAQATVSLGWTTQDVITIQPIPTTYSTLGAEVSLQVKASDSAPGQTLSYSATGLPAGLSVNGQTGLISGTPTAFGDSSVQLTVADSSTSVTVAFAWLVHGVLTVGRPAKLPGAVGDLVNVGVPAADSDGSATLAYSATGLPPDLSIFGGLIYGWAATAGRYHVKVSVTDSLGATASVSFSWRVRAARDAGPAGPVRLDLGGFCLAEAGLARNGYRRAEIRRCDGKTGQRWVVVQDNTLRLGGDCLGTAAGGTSAGTAAEVGPCQGGAADRWEVASDGQLVGQASGLCLTDPGSSTHAGTGLAIATCTLGSNQRWTLPAGQLISWRAGRCLVYQAASGSSLVSLAPCTSAASQQWTIEPDGTITADGGCLTDTGGTAGGAVAVQACTGGADQDWSPSYPLNTDGWQLSSDGVCLENPIGGSASAASAGPCGSPQYVGDSQTWLIR